MKTQPMFFLICFLLFWPTFLARPEVPSDDNKITLEIQGMDVVDVLKMLSAKRQINLVIDKNVTGRVTVFLKDVTPDEAFSVILASNGLVCDKEGAISRIMTAQDYGQQCVVERVPLKYLRPQDLLPVLSQMKSGQGHIVADDGSGALILMDTPVKNAMLADLIRQMDLPLVTRTFDVNYAAAEKVASALQDVITQGLGKIRCDTRANKVIVTDRADVLEKVRDMVRRLDDRTREVSIDAKIVQVNLNDKTSLGVDWEYIMNDKIRAQGMFGQMLTTTGHIWTMGTMDPTSPKDYRVVIEALQTIGRTRILSAPRLTVANNESAKILVGSKQVYVTTAAVQGQTSTQTAETVNFVDVGVKLFVTPSITADGFVSLKIRPEVSSVVQNYKTSAGNTIPIVETSEAETTVLVRDGQTLVIAGLMKDERTKTTNKIPFLGDIPWVGRLFSGTTDETKKTELAIFLTCRIANFKK